MSNKTSDNRCKGTTKDGQPCRAAATAGGLCFFHANPNKAIECGRIGGRVKSAPVFWSDEPVLKLDSGAAVHQLITRLITDVCSGRLHRNTAAAIAPLINIQLRSIEAKLVEEQMAELRKRPHGVSAQFAAPQPPPTTSGSESELQHPEKPNEKNEKEDERE